MKQSKRILLAAFGTAVSIATIAYISTKIDWKAFTKAIHSIGWTIPLACAATYCLSFLPRAIRCKRLLSHSQISLSGGGKAVIVGYAVNNVLPFRLGEVGRALFLRKLEHVAFSTGISSVAAERILDGLAILTLFSVGVLGLARTGALLDASTAQWLILAAALVFIGAIAGLFLITALVRPLQQMIHRYLGDKAVAIAQQIDEALAFLRQPAETLRILLLSMVVWITETIGFYLLLTVMDVPHPFFSALYLLGLINLGILIPSAPGYVGVFQALSVIGFVTMNLTEAQGLAFGIVLHVTQFVPATLAGLVILLSSGMHFRDLIDYESG